MTVITVAHMANLWVSQEKMETDCSNGDISIDPNLEPVKCLTNADDILIPLNTQHRNHITESHPSDTSVNGLAWNLA